MPQALRNVLLGLLVVGCIALVSALAFWQVNSDIRTPVSLSQPALYKVEPGSTAAGVLRDFKDKGWLEAKPLSYRIWLKFFAPQTDIRAGTYQIASNATFPDVLAQMVRGEEYQFSVSLIEGLTVRDWLDELAAHPALIYDVDDTALSLLIAGAEIDGAALSDDTMTVFQLAEGLFLADTYYFTDGTRATMILERAMEDLLGFLRQQWQQRDVDLPLSSPYDALVLASIIEKETAVAAERAHIAGVFINRLNKNMRLQTDPTVIYGLGDDFDGNLTRDHLKQATPYNTYVIRGLPPTPIAMAGKAAIIAALNPHPTDDLYFVARGDGTHVFSATLEAHNRAVYEYQILPNKKK